MGVREHLRRFKDYEAQVCTPAVSLAIASSAIVGVAIVSVVGDRHLLLTSFDLPLTTYYLLLSTYYGLGGGGGAGDDRGHSAEAWLGLGYYPNLTLPEPQPQPQPQP